FHQQNIVNLIVDACYPPRMIIKSRIVLNIVSNKKRVKFIYRAIKKDKTRKLTVIFNGRPTTKTFNCGTVLATIPKATSTKKRQPTIGKDILNAIKNILLNV